MNPFPNIIVRTFGMVDYEECYAKMQAFTNARDEHTADEIWVLEHFPVYTQGQAGKKEHLINAHGIPVVQSDRGGQITYHGPGQLILYPLLSLKRFHLGPRTLVSVLEKTVLRVLREFNIEGTTDKKAPGVYVDGKKIASIGLRIRRNSSYHGLSFNVLMDLTPFDGINPCGYAGLQMTQLASHVPSCTIDAVKPHLIEAFLEELRGVCCDNIH